MVTYNAVCIWNIADYLYVYRTLLWLSVYIRTNTMVTCIYMNITMVVCMYMEHCYGYLYVHCIWHVAIVTTCMCMEHCYGYL